jgi:hypothetical protein
VTATGQLFKVVPYASEIYFLTESEDIDEAFKEQVWKLEHSYVPGGWTSVEWRTVYNEQNRKDFTSRFRPFNDEQDMEFMTAHIAAI